MQAPASFRPSQVLIALVVAVAALVGQRPLRASEPAADRMVAADLAVARGPMNRMYNFCVGAGPANEGLRADWQRHSP